MSALRLALLLAAGGAAAGLMVAAAGLVPVAASAGHSPLTAWFLHFTMRSAVRTQSLRIVTPPLDDPVLVERAAGHFETSCAPCHGAPGRPQAAAMTRTTPPPPGLQLSADEWAPREQFWIVKHGIKYTGMPAWIAPSRDDEIWAMVAFLRRLPQMSAREYLALSGADRRGEARTRLQTMQALHGADAPTIELCAGCHGYDGNGSPTGAFPRLAGQSEAYLLASLEAYAGGARASGIMQPLAASLDRATMRRLAAHYALQTPQAADAASADAAAEQIRQGGDIAMRGLPQQGVPPCASCHAGSGPRNPTYPLLDGQYPVYISTQLRLLRSGARGGTAYATLMQLVASRLSDAQIDAVAAFYGTLAPVQSSSDGIPSKPAR